jgi:ferredoxin
MDATMHDSTTATTYRVGAGDRSGDVAAGTRLVLAIESLGVDIGHRCGGKARCTTCRVRFLEGEPDTMTRAEFAKLRDAGLLGDVRLSCQIALEGDATVEVLKTLQSEGWTDTGPAPDPEVVPEAAWFDRRQLEREAEAG